MAFKKLETRAQNSGYLGAKKEIKRKPKIKDDMTVGVLGAVSLHPHIGSRQLAAHSGLEQTAVVNILHRHQFHLIS